MYFLPFFTFTTVFFYRYYRKYGAVERIKLISFLLCGRSLSEMRSSALNCKIHVSFQSVRRYFIVGYICQRLWKSSCLIDTANFVADIIAKIRIFILITSHHMVVTLLESSHSPLLNCRDRSHSVPSCRSVPPQGGHYTLRLHFLPLECMPQTEKAIFTRF